MDCGCENFVKNQPAGVLRREVNQLAEERRPEVADAGERLLKRSGAPVFVGASEERLITRDRPFGHFFQAPAQGRFELVTGAGQDSSKA